MQLSDLNEKIQKLPQREHIDMEEALVWLGKMSEIKEVTDWDIAQLAYFHPRESHILVKELDSERADFGTMNEIIKEKLMKSVYYPNPRDKRTLMMMPLLKETIMREHRLIEDHETLHKIHAHHYSYPYISGLFLDNLFKREDGSHLIVLFDAPMDPLESVTEAQYCHLHYLGSLYRLALAKDKIDLIVVSLDYTSSELRLHPVAFDKQCANKLFKAMGVFYRGFLLKGLIPPFIKRDPNKVIPALTDSTRQMVDEYLKIESFYKSAYGYREKMKRKVMTQPDAKADRRLSHFKKPVVDADQLTRFAQLHPDILSACAKESVEYDFNKLLTLCEAQGISAPLIEEEITYISRGATSELVKGYMPAFEHTIGELFNDNNALS